MPPSVHSVLVAAAAGEPMLLVPRASLVAGLGIRGDRYATGLGHWSAPRWLDQQLTLIESEHLERLGLTAAQLRRNIVTRGIDLTAHLGQEVTLGQVRILLVRPCEPCRYIELFTHTGAFKELEGLSGVRAAILTSGDVHAGDAIAASIGGPPVGAGVADTLTHPAQTCTNPSPSPTVPTQPRRSPE